MIPPVEIGRRVRGMRLSPAHGALSLGARAAWLELSLAADDHPQLRRPRALATPLDGFTVFLGADPEDARAALLALVAAGILQPVGPDGLYRLARY